MDNWLVYGLLTLSFLLLWHPQKETHRHWLWVLCGATLVALVMGKLSWLALICLGGFYGVLIATKRASGWYAVLGKLVVAVMFVMFGAHLLPGFERWDIVESQYLKPDSGVFSFSFSLDKTIAAILLIGTYLNTQVQSWKRVLTVVSSVTLILLCTLFPLMYGLGFIRWQPEFLVPWLSLTLLFMWKQLLVTCVAEEAFFRGFMQPWLSSLGPEKWGKVIGLLATSGLFALAHAGGGSKLILASFIAGMGYGIAYWWSQRWEAAVLVHWLVNVLHFMLFSYPFYQAQ
ncbi:CPBP family intramembrane glutamic endopeptidase [Pleionea sp. CnH1-48]|uniref:CPBP family intramembrane glutamic endopeptidase n=1 Tax=Pleionea sp. CnH1-48 TaxID=2954494 RepID=UPI0020977814|nr:CPBP family intramembrane glutamic endopeptidase [Pleionea sp. CnH1-48]MCO7226487.1 CPBP family intramembrane metalloprotease [Pleionea sp. CnH1-48]